LYTYRVAGEESGDLKRSRLMSEHFGLPLTIATIPTGVDSIISDVTTMLREGVRGKVCIQCMHGHYYVAPLVEEPVIVNGSGVDALYGAYRTFAFDGSRKDKAAFDRARQAHLDAPNDDAMLDQAKCYAARGAHPEVVYPYRAQPVVDYLMGLSWVEINKPRLKWVTVRDYPEYDWFPRYYRARGSQQIVAGTRALHDKLLRSPVNTRGRKRVDEIYKDMAEAMGL
jgi:hypothetical protein